MKIRTLFLVTLVLFSLMLAGILTSIVFTEQQVERISAQEQLALELEREASELSYLSNEYLLYREPQQRTRWQAKFAAFSDDLSRLTVNTPEGVSLVNNIKANAQRLQAIFVDAAAGLGTMPAADIALNPALIQVPWSRMQVQNQAIVFDVSRLGRALHTQADDLKRTSLMLALALVGLLGLYVIANYFLVYRRVLRSVELLQEGVRVIGAGDLDHAIPVRYADEIGDLTHSFNHMAANLQAVMASKADLEREMADRKRAEAEVKSVARFPLENPNAVLRVSAAGTILFANASAEPLLKSWSTRVGEPAPETWRTAVARVHSTGRAEIAEACVQDRVCSLDLAPVAGMPYVNIYGRDITETKQAEEQIRTLNRDLEQRAADLERTNQELQAFSYSVSHDLRAPLSAVNNFAKLLIEEYHKDLDPVAQKYLEMVASNAKQMDLLVDGLLRLSRLDRRALQPCPVEVADLVKEVLAELAPQMEGRRIEISVGELPACVADPVLLRQVYANLLNNAVKFTRLREVAQIEIGSWTIDVGKFKSGGAGKKDGPGSTPSAMQHSGSSSQAARPDLNFPVYFVRDNGVGFDPADADRLFGMFQRLHGEHEYEGTGVGLALVHRIIYRHGGRVWAEAIKDKGATFYFTLG